MLNTGDALSIVDNIIVRLPARLNQSFEYNISVEIYDRNSGKPLAKIGQNSLTVESQNLSLPKNEISSEKIYLLSSLAPLVEHIVKHDRVSLYVWFDRQIFSQMFLSEFFLLTLSSFLPHRFSLD